MDITTVIAIISVTCAVVSVILTIVARIKANVKESNLELIKYRLDELDKNMEKILAKLDKYDEEVDGKIEKAMDNHIAMFHRRSKKGD